jgi:superfamily II DNA or RNA helicase
LDVSDVERQGQEKCGSAHYSVRGKVTFSGIAGPPLSSLLCFVTCPQRSRLFGVHHDENIDKLSPNSVFVLSSSRKPLDRMIVPAEVGENLLPRRYQEEIFARAQEGNIIAALDTGSGKTFISTLLMKWIASRHASDKKIVFLVPKVALVEQQADFIGKQTPLRVTRFHGAMSIELTDRGKWKTEFEATDVLVMTG